MKIKHWLKTLSSATAAVDDGATTSSSVSSTTSSVTFVSSLQSNLSLQTLPSVPSLQTTLLSPTLNLAVHHRHVFTVSPLHHRSAVSSLAAQNNLLYSASGNQVNVYDVSDPNNLVLVESFNGNDPNSGSVKSIVFCKENVVTAHQNGKIKVWRLQKESKKHKLLTTLPTVNDRIKRFVFPGSYVQVRIHKKRMWIEHNDAVSALAVKSSSSDQNDIMCSVSWDKSMKIWRPRDHFKCMESIPAHDDAVNAVVVSKDGMVYTGCADGRIRAWDRPAGSERYGLAATLEKHKSAVNALALSADGGTLFSGACDRSILVWEREDSARHMAISGALRGHGKAILCLVNYKDMLMSGSADRTVRIWARGEEGRFCCLAVLEGHRSPVKSMVAGTGSDSAVAVYSGGLDGEIRVWEVTVRVSNNNPVKESSSTILFLNHR